MPFNIEDQYQQYLYPDAMDFVKNESSGRHVAAASNYSPQPTNANMNANANAKRAPLPPNAIKVLILNNPSKLNKRLIKFFTTNIDFMNRNGMFFEWVVVYEDEMDHYEEQNITEFPVLINGNEQIAGANGIIDRLRGSMSSSKQQGSRPSTGGNDDSELRNYFLKELDNKNDDDMDEDDMFANTITQRVAAMNKSRSVNGQHTVRMTNPEIHERTAKSASKHNNYNFNESRGDSRGASNYDNPLQNAMNNARKQTGKSASKPARADNLEYTPAEETSRRDAPSAAEIARTTSKGSMDDELMLRYWENQETTDF